MPAVGRGSCVVIHHQQQVAGAVVGERGRQLYRGPFIGSEIDISAEYTVCGSDRHPVAAKGGLAGVYHVDVKVSGRGIPVVVERNAIDVTSPADLPRRINLLRQRILVSDIGRCCIRGVGTMSDLDECGGIRHGCHSE